ncbi:MAG: prepilin-type N-terminal cleavage/methylation domain-containing protein [Candidatus Omnitrophica bacterium]|nr:prepilin-type N-terminal cleavage/methylation domain-containing protein [Candidatus Omnitrophota bacterium]
MKIKKTKNKGDKKMKLNKKGFTLLEIIIVIIIIGVLAALALPRFFKTVEFSRSTEALIALSSLRQSVERCSLSAAASTSTACTNLSNLDVVDPATSGGAHFSYAISSADSAGQITVEATRNTVDGGDGSSTITLTATTGSVTRAGSSSFSGIK